MSFTSARAAAWRGSRTKRPSGPTSDRPPESGRPSVRFTWSPTPRPESRSALTATASIAAVARTVVLLTIPWRCAARIPALTPDVRPKSSALTMSRRVIVRSLRGGALDHEPLDGHGNPGREGGFRVHRSDVLESLVPDSRERLDFAGDDRRREPRRLELRERGLQAEEREDRDDQPAARTEVRAPAITRSKISQPSAPPLSAAAAASCRARFDGVGIWGAFVHTRSNRSPTTG